MSIDRINLTRRRFMSNFAFATGAIATGVGSWVIRPDWANAAEGAIKVGIATDLTGPIAYAGNADANVAKMVIKQINDSGGLISHFYTGEDFALIHLSQPIGDRTGWMDVESESGGDGKARGATHQCRRYPSHPAINHMLREN